MNRLAKQTVKRVATGGDVFPLVSIAIPNHRRPHLLKRVLHGLSQLDYPAFEIVVVGDQPSIQDYGLPGDWASLIRYSQFVEPNICKSRNIAISLASGEVVAFCDDDGVPEPNWLRQLVVPFTDKRVGAVAGTVRGADGVRVDWGGGHFDRSGEEVPVPMPKGIQIVDAQTQLSTNTFLGLMGVNTAFRREALLSVGGFDEAIRYYLDETDMALRLAEAGWSTAIAPAAEVHHLHEVNASRGSLRTPRNLVQIAASKAYFCHRHMAEGDVKSELERFRLTRLADMDPYLRLGVLRAAGRRDLEQQLERGLKEGLTRTQNTPLPKAQEKPGFQRFSPARRVRALRIALVTGWGLGRTAKLRSAARRLAAAGHRVSCFSFSSGPHPLTVTFEDGVWLHTGGTWRLPRRLRGLKACLRRVRAWAEVDRTVRTRGYDLILSAGSVPDPDAQRLAAVPGLPRLTAVPLGMKGQAFIAASHQIAAFLSKSPLDETALGRLDQAPDTQEMERIDGQEGQEDPLMTLGRA